MYCLETEKCKIGTRRPMTQSSSHDVAKRFRALPDMISPVLWAKTFFWPADRRDYVTRRPDGVYLPTIKNELYRNILLYSGGKLFNDLPPHIKLASDIDDFKKKYFNFIHNSWLFMLLPVLEGTVDENAAVAWRSTAAGLWRVNSLAPSSHQLHRTLTACRPCPTSTFPPKIGVAILYSSLNMFYFAGTVD